MTDSHTLSADALRLVTALPIPALLIDATERIEASNAAAHALFGHDGTGRHYITVVRQPGALDIIERALREGEEGEGRFLGQEGGRDTTWRTWARRVNLGNGAYVLVVFEDITDLEEAGQIRRDFVANVSHELRTPLTALIGFVETLRGSARDDRAAQDRFLGIIAREATRMARLVDDLLSLSRVEAEERRRPTERVDVTALTASVVATLEPLASREGTAIRLVAPEAAVVVPGDPNQLRQLVTNLVENAIKYGGRGGPITVEIAGSQDQPILRRAGVQICVRDQGPGIAAHHIPRLTERFYRVDSHRSREIGGTGLGLAIVKHIVSRHRGRLRIESKVGQGSRFTVILPAD
ncbi:ATP-binding protein [Rubellimicrobium sp. CFH 75288]|uniref:ATP-binding protein n=1 Tax=Rubellimicrobium sp. CFH 75288 TaxID=2697034 RepID=UPI001412C4F0|nr:ATP-binding protein [Rubellimicrobium sp. CFH 75288]NAZ36919.1 two-component sensor histidine kinase [Rubellimicrobium sp. CFH 75288]